MRSTTQNGFDGYMPKGNFHLIVIERVIVCAGLVLHPYVGLRFSETFFTYSDFCFCLSLVVLLITGKIQKRPLYGATQLWLLAFMLLLLGLMIGSLSQSRPDRSLIVVAQYLFSYLLLMIVLIRKDPSEAHFLAAVFLGSIVLVDVHGLYTYYQSGYVPGEGKSVVTGAMRLATVYGNPNLAASMNALAMPFVLFFWSSRRLKFYFALPLVAIILFAVVLTSSVSGLFILSVSLLVFLMSILTWRLLVNLMLGVGIVVGLVASLGGTDLLPATFQRRVLDAAISGNLNEAGTYVSRSALNKEAIGIIADEQIVFVGIGADQFRERSVQGAPVHNLYLLLWVEGGVLAVVGWLLFSGTGVVIWFSIREAGGSRNALALVATVVTVFLTIAIFNPHMYARYWTLPVFLAFGVGLTHLKRVEPLGNMRVSDGYGY